MSCLRDLGFPIDDLSAPDRATYEALTDAEAAQLDALCAAVRAVTTEVEGFGPRVSARRSPALGGASGMTSPLDLPDLPGQDVEIIPDNVRVLGALYYAWTLGGWPP